MKGYPTRAKTAAYSFPVKQHTDAGGGTRRDKNQLNVGQHVFKLEDILPSIHDPVTSIIRVPGPGETYAVRSSFHALTPSTNQAQRASGADSSLLPPRQKTATTARILDFSNTNVDYGYFKPKSRPDASSLHGASTTFSTSSLPPPQLNPKLKFLKSQGPGQTLGIPQPHLSTLHPPLKNVNSLLAPMNFSTSGKSKQFNPTTTSSYRYELIKSATRHVKPGTLLQDPKSGQSIPAPSPSSSISSKSRRTKASPSNSQKSSENELTQQQSNTNPSKLVATTTEVELLKLTPRDPSTIKSGMFIIDNPSKISNPSQTKKYHICRSAEERDQNPDAVYLDKLNLKHFPSIDSTETQLRLISLQHNLIHRIDNTNLTIQPNLLVLDLYNNRIDRISGLHIFSSLKVLLLGKNRIRKIEGLDMLKHLEILDLHGNQLRYLDNINSLMSLRVLNVAGNVIRSIRNFGPYGISSLQELNLKRNHLQNLTGILKMTHLKKLSLGNNDIQAVSVLLPLKKLDTLQELQLQPNPICDLPDYVNQVIALLPKLMVLDGIPVTDDMRHRAEIWHRKKVAEENERRKEQEKIRLLSSTATRDEVIFKARKRWESLRNYVKQNSIGSGRFNVQKGTSTEDRLVRQNAIVDSTFVNQDEKKFTVELELEDVPETNNRSKDNSTDTEPLPQPAAPEDSVFVQNEDGVPAQVNQLEEKIAQMCVTIENVHETVDIYEQSAETFITASSSTAHAIPLASSSNSRPTVKIAIVKPSVRQPLLESEIEIEANAESLPVLSNATVSPKIPFLLNAMKTMGHSILEEDEEEDVRSESMRFSDFAISDEHTLLEEAAGNEPTETTLKSGTESSSLLHNQSDFSSLALIPPPIPKLPSRRPVLRRSMSQFTLSVSKEATRPQTTLRKPTPKVPASQNKSRKALSRSKSIADLPDLNQVDQVSNDSDTPSDIESVVTINTTSDTGSATTSNATPRKLTGKSRPRLIRSSSTRNLLKPKGKAARLASANVNPNFLSPNRPLTSVGPNISNPNLVKSEPQRPVLRRSESAMNLHTATLPEVVVKKQGVDYLVEMNDKLLNIYGQGALKHMLTAFSSNSTGSITMVTFHFITFDSIIPYFGKMRQIYPALEHFHFRANGLICLSQLNALADLQGITSLYVYQDGNPLVEAAFWQEYAMYRLSHWGLQQVNGSDASSSHRNLGGFGTSASSKENQSCSPKTFESLGYLALSCLPQSALTPLAERLHMLHCFCCCSTSNSSDDSGKKRPDNTSNTCTSYWDDDPVLLDVIGKEALVYGGPQNEVPSTSRDAITEIFDSGCEIIQKLTKLEQAWPSLMVDVIEDILLDYQVMDNFMKKELLGLKNSLAASSPSSNARRKQKF